MARWDAGQRAGVMLLEAKRPVRERVEIRRSKLLPAVAAEHMAVKAIEKDDDSVPR